MATKTKSPAELKAEGEELKALFAKVKKKPHNCAVLMSKDGVVIEAHIKKSPDILLKLGKKNGGMPKGAWGTMTMEGQIIKIDPINDKIPGNLTKLAKKFFGARGLKYRLEIVEPEEGEEANKAAVAEEQGTGRSSASEEESHEAADTDDKKKELETRLAEMQDQIDVLLDDKENVMFSALQDGLSAHKRAMDGEDHERGASTLDVLDGVLEDYAGLVAEKTPLQERMSALAAAIERVKKGDNSEVIDQIGRIGREFDYALANNEWIGAAERLDLIEQLTEEHAGQAGAEEEADVQAKAGTDSQEASPSADHAEEEAADTEETVKREAAKSKRKNIMDQMKERLQSMMADLK